jgi:hypothetical protein
VIQLTSNPDRTYNARITDRATGPAIKVERITHEEMHIFVDHYFGLNHDKSKCPHCRRLRHGDPEIQKEDRSQKDRAKKAGSTQ